MKISYKTLSQFLVKFDMTVQQLKRRTGISIYRLRVIYEDGQFTYEEFKKLVKALGARPAVSMAYAS